MDAVHLARLTTVLAVGVVGGVAGHVLVPFSPGVGAGPKLLFVALVAGTGALRGWRARVLQGELHGTPPTRVARTAALFALAALAASWAGFALVHGSPFR